MKKHLHLRKIKLARSALDIATMYHEFLINIDYEKTDDIGLMVDAQQTENDAKNELLAAVELIEEME